MSTPLDPIDPAESPDPAGDTTAEELPVNDPAVDDDLRTDPDLDDQPDEVLSDDPEDDPDLMSARRQVDNAEESLGTDDLLPDEPFHTD